jgi:twitching motility protein PilT
VSDHTQLGPGDPTGAPTRTFDAPDVPQRYIPSFVPETEPTPYPAPLPPTPAPAPASVSEPMSRLGIDDSATQGVQLADLLEALIQCGGSDLHLTAGAPPTIRLHGVMRPVEDTPRFTPPDLQRIVYQIISQKQRERFEENLELDFAYSLPGRARFRVNVYRQRDSIGAVFRVIPTEIKPLEALGMPPQVGNFAGLTRGFVLVTGPTGSGKSTTLAAIVDLANRTRHDHIMTVEDPIEFLHRHQNCVVNQREVGEDTLSFSNALKHALRQDPDIILVGELRDLETTSTALTAAETGHLVLATLHTQSASQTVNRIIDIFPSHQQHQVRSQLSTALQGVVTQALAPRADGTGRAIVTEVMLGTPAIRNLIREGKTHQISSFMQAGGGEGMLAFDQHLAERVHSQIVSFEQALEICHSPEEFKRLARRG